MVQFRVKIMELLHNAYDKILNIETEKSDFSVSLLRFRQRMRHKALQRPQQKSEPCRTFVLRFIYQFALEAEKSIPYLTKLIVFIKIRTLKIISDEIYSTAKQT